MNATASIATSPRKHAVNIARAEHISIEAGTEDAAPSRAPYRKVRAKYALRSGLRNCAIELALLDDHYLQVHSTPRRRAPLKYTLDLRFLNPQPVRVRHIAWRWFAATALLTASAGTTAWLASRGALPDKGLAFMGAAAAALAAGAAAFMGVRGTSESLNFNTVTGAAPVVKVIGSLGSTKHGKTFFVTLIKEIAAAKTARAQARPQWLRDEMREHHRLRELGVLSEAEYEASKARILGAHSE